MEWAPSGELSERLAALPRRQERAVLRIVQAEADGTPLIRLLKTPYSCRWCGLRVGDTGVRRDDRMAMLARHEEGCKRRGETWRFVVSLRTYYGKWVKDEAFQEALGAAREDLRRGAMASAVTSLQAGTGDAVAEVRRQIAEASEGNRLKAAFGLLDRAGVETAAKQAMVVDEDELNRRIERELARLAGGGEGGVPPAVGGDADAGGDHG